VTKEIVLLVAHGARGPGNEGNREVEEFTDLWRQRYRGVDIRVLLPSGLEEAAVSLGGGGGRLLVLPLILNAAGHVKRDIPQAIAAARARHPDVEFRYGCYPGTAEPTVKGPPLSSAPSHGQTGDAGPPYHRRRAAGAGCLGYRGHRRDCQDGPLAL